MLRAAGCFGAWRVLWAYLGPYKTYLFGVPNTMISLCKSLKVGHLGFKVGL